MRENILCCVLLAALFSIQGCGSKAHTVYLEPDTQDAGIVDTEDSVKEPASCYVYICGAVEAPGVYELPENSRVFDVIAAAGGLSEDASEDSVNQAEPVTDGQMIRIPTQQEEREALQNAEQDSRVNLNSATVEELMTLPGIGESKAESIVSYREEHGGFSSIEDLMNISGIKEGVFDKIKGRIRVN
ncbi:MAG: helix-hairpin-helix domain-containing protein [Lachnospiraceae bacterium]|nr:helix-hairpin-helix domain-containing protein [Lachnospiraceae bacterium]